MFKKFKITCDEATTICDKSQYGEASLYEKLKLSWHLIACKVCVLYSKQNKRISKLLKFTFSGCKKNTPCLTSNDKEELKEQLRKFN